MQKYRNIDLLHVDYRTKQLSAGVCVCVCAQGRSRRMETYTKQSLQTVQQHVSSISLQVSQHRWGFSFFTIQKKKSFKGWKKVFDKKVSKIC